MKFAQKTFSFFLVKGLKVSKLDNLKLSRKNYIVGQTANDLRWSAIVCEDETGKEHVACTKSLRKCHIPVFIIVFSVAKIHLNLLPQTLTILPENKRDHQAYNSWKKS
jgi:hypothetical protein